MGHISNKKRENALKLDKAIKKLSLINLDEKEEKSWIKMFKRDAKERNFDMIDFHLRRLKKQNGLK